MTRKAKPEDRTWGYDADGSRHVIGMTVAELRASLLHFQDTDEVFMAVCPKKYWNGGGLLGALKAVEFGVPGEIWLKALVVVGIS